MKLLTRMIAAMAIVAAMAAPASAQLQVPTDRSDFPHELKHPRPFWLDGHRVYRDNWRRHHRRDTRRGWSRAHERWCYGTYRSYRAWDNTFKPHRGPRRQCHSPYG